MEHPYLPITRKDGTSLYLLRDLAYTLWKEKRAKDRNIVVLGEDQKLYYQQLKVILSILEVSADKNITFDVERALSFEGETAPYIQYAHARAKSIIKKSKIKKTD